MSTDEALQQQVREVVAQFGRLSCDVAALDTGDDLFRAGLTSHASVNVMLGLEDEFDVEFPDSMLHRGTFESIAAMATALRTLLGSNAAVAS